MEAWACAPRRATPTAPVSHSSRPKAPCGCCAPTRISPREPRNMRWWFWRNRCARGVDSAVSVRSSKQRGASPHRIDHLQERKPAEIRIARADARHPMLAHEDCCVRVVNEVAGEMRQFGKNRFGDFRVPLRLDEHTQSRRGKQRSNELPGCCNSPRAAHHARMCRHPQELVENRPGRVPGIGTHTLTGKPVAAWFV